MSAGTLILVNMKLPFISCARILLIFTQIIINDPNQLELEVNEMLKPSDDSHVPLSHTLTEFAQF